MSMIEYNIYIYGSIAIGTALFLLLICQERKPRLPPGPKGWPILGNALDVPKETPWLTFADWGKKYGDVMYMNVLGTQVVVVNSMKVAKELLDKRSLIYSDRPRLNMASLCGYDRTFTLQSYGYEWRQQRKLVVQEFNPTHCRDYYHLQDRRAAILVQNLLQNPSRLVPELNLQIGAVILRAAYGYTVQSDDDPWLNTGLQMMHEFDLATTLGNFTVDFIPWIKHIPAWIPGASFQKKAKLWRSNHDRVAWEPLTWSKNHWESGKALMPNMCGNLYQAAGGKLSKEVESQLAYALPAVLGGGLDTNVTTALSFFMAMILYPEVQKKAQAELDAVVGRDRLPSISDKANLPYIRAVMTEVYRWAPAGPLSVPHAPKQDDEYDGMLIPKGSMVIPNVWKMLHDPEDYTNPMDFIPERFQGLDTEMDKIKNVSFGFGRRMCPGMYFAEGTFFAIVATTLATCDILPGLDENGKEVLPKYAYTSSVVSFPEPFEIRLRPRSIRASSLLTAVCHQPTE
ncbi:putative monooxygenase [Panaeolus papilionaceus]|nr:putative monooxygenase [Panaeolus papilionaceus]